jgi:hypothetical protein
MDMVSIRVQKCLQRIFSSNKFPKKNYVEGTVHIKEFKYLLYEQKILFHFKNIQSIPAHNSQVAFSFHFMWFYFYSIKRKKKSCVSIHFIVNEKIHKNCRMLWGICSNSLTKKQLLWLNSSLYSFRLCNLIFVKHNLELV